MRPRQIRRDQGLTLVEMLVVIVIIGILMSLLVPAVMSAIQKGREAAVSAEINAMAQALASFKNRFGDYPPSRLVCVENGDYSYQGTGANLSGTAAQLAPRSIAALRRYWPRMTISANGAPAASSIPNGFYDFNGDGTTQGATPYILSGPQCLVFFLGGIPQSTAGGWAVTGFAKNPANPMQNSSVTTNRETPLYEFNNGRLIGLGAPSGTGTIPFPAYMDSLGGIDDTANPPVYTYWSAYGGVGYDPDDYNATTETDDSGSVTPPICGAFYTANAATPNAYTSGSGSGATTYATIVSSPAPNPYTSSVPVATNSTGHVYTTTPIPPAAYINPNSFQIISPGRDRLYGIGGQFVQNPKSTAATPLPFVDGSSGYTANTFQTQQANADVTGQTLSASIRQREQDNITNFATGRLQ